jgi:pimeloyl-ACP methyl ester carboxylesterase
MSDSMQVRGNGIAIEVDDQGPRNGEPLLLIMGLGMQLVGWPDELVQRLTAAGFRVVRFDNRDAGLSQGFDHLGVPNIVAATLRHALRLPVPAPYSLGDMARDAAGVLDALGIARAHVCGASMGGMIAQRLAVHHPERVKSLTLMMTTSGARRLPQASARARRALLSRPASSAEDDVIAQLMSVLEVIGSPAYRPDAQDVRQRLRHALRRAYRPAGTLRQLVAIAADGDRSPGLGGLRMPCHVIHGTADPLVPVAGGIDLAAKIGGATRDLIDGMGHDLPLPLLPRFAAGIVQAAARV